MPSRVAVITCVVLAVPLAACLLSCQRSKKGDLSVKQWNNLVSRSLPPGSSGADVEKFLDQRGIEHSYIARSNFPDETNSIVALIKNKDDYSIVKKSGIQFKFKLDADQHL